MRSSDAQYVHGYGARERERLAAQAECLRELIHADTVYPDACRVLEIGCGTGAQTLQLSRRSVGARITAIDRSEVSLAVAASSLREAAITNVELRLADAHALPFEADSFDHAFGAFVLEHLVSPLDALAEIARVLKPGGSVTLVEGDHASVLIDPPSDAALEAIACQAELQRRAGGDAMIGRRLFPLLDRVGFAAIRVVPRTLYVNRSVPELAPRAEFAFVAMIEAVRAPAIEAGIADPETFDAGIGDLRRAIRDGVFSYTFFKAVACKAT